MKIAFLPVLLLPIIATADDAPPRCEIIPIDGHQFSFRIDGIEKTRWHTGIDYPRPYFFPLNGPSGESLTRMGHPGAPNHDHHQSVWFAHHDVEGHSFWAYSGEGTIRQKEWLSIEDGEEEGVFSALLGWFAPEGVELLEQELVVAIRPHAGGSYELEIQFTLRPPGKRELIRLEKTNFGLLAVRVAKSISTHFGGGRLTNSDGIEGEKEIFGKEARWMDYSGPVAIGTGDGRSWTDEGITFFDHPDNPRHPSHWHVRDDGWMGASFCFDEGYDVTPENALTLRYLLHLHSGEVDSKEAEKVFDAFSKRSKFVVSKSEKPHWQYQVVRHP